MDEKQLLCALGFVVKDGSKGIYTKSYVNNYSINVDFQAKRINYGNKIKAENGTTQNFSQQENWVVLECVDRLLTKGYPPESVILEKTWPAGHGTSGRLDICVARDDGSEYLLIECKTSGGEFEKACSRLQKDGGQLFTYFKFSNKADVILLYASSLLDGKVVYQNAIIKIEDVYRTGDTKDFYQAWNKLTKDNGVFDAWVTPYDFQSRALTLADLQEISEADSHRIFNQFLEILRHNVVSDKPNAFNKIFTLFLCKVYDEKSAQPGDELKFQWLDGVDDDVSFQLRLADLYRDGMKDFLNKDVTDLSDAEFGQKFSGLDDQMRDSILSEIKRLRLEKNNEFAIKEVFDHKSFCENAKVVKEVVELLQGYRIRYSKRHQYLSDFFELLLTTGLKQESGQFFTPVPVAQFVARSLPINKIVDTKLQTGRKDDLLPYVIDYAAGSGHFLTETMHEIQRLVGAKNGGYTQDTNKVIKSWQEDHFSWAEKYIYGVEKDYRLVKVGKVGCYLHGDGLANIVHSDGLGSFENTPEYKDKLKIFRKENSKENAQFDVVVSNPPYSVSAFKANARSYYTEQDFELYSNLTDASSEIEALFVERTLQLLKEGGVAGVVLPRSLLSNGGIYERARELLLKACEVVALVELGGNTFMATGTNTVIVFLRRRNNLLAQQLAQAIDKFFVAHQEVAIRGIEKPISTYLEQVWGGLPLSDYLGLVHEPTEALLAHPIYKRYASELQKTNGKAEAKIKRGKLAEAEYQDKLSHHRDKQEAVFRQAVLAAEKEKLLYFLLAHGQQVVIVNSGEKEEEKKFLGYYFSDRRGFEGIHPMRGNRIEECTKLFDSECFDNPEKASTYIHQAFSGNFTGEIHAGLLKHVHRANLVDMFTFDNPVFDKAISTHAKKKATELKSRWPLARLGDVAEILSGGTPSTSVEEYWNGDICWATLVDTKEKYLTNTQRKISKLGLQGSGAVLLPINTVIFSSRATIGDVCINKVETCTNQGYKNFVCNKNKIEYTFLYYMLKHEAENIAHLASGATYPEVSKTKIADFKIPLPPIESGIQQKIVAEIEAIENQEAEAEKQLVTLQIEIENLFSGIATRRAIGDFCLLSSARIDPADSPDGNFNYVGLEHIAEGSGEIAWGGSVKGETVKSTKNVFHKGDVLYGKLRPYLNKVWIAEFDGVCSTEMLVLKPNVPEAAILLKYLLLSRDFVEQAKAKTTGISLPRIKPADVLQIEVPDIELQVTKLSTVIQELETKITEERSILSALKEQKLAVLLTYLE